MIELFYKTASRTDTRGLYRTYLDRDLFELYVIMAGSVLLLDNSLLYWILADTQMILILGAIYQII